MPLKWNLPPSVQKAINEFVGLPDEKVNHFFDILKKEDSQDQSELANSISTQCELSTEQCREIIGLIVSFYITTEQGNSFEDVLKALKDVEGIEEKNHPKLSGFGKRLEELFNSGSIFIAKAKSVDLLYAREKILRATRCITDLRPIFTTKNKDKVHAYLTIHNLKIEYSEGRRTQEIVLALDIKDVQKLKNQLEDTITKSKTLIRDFSGKDIEVWEE